MYLNAGHSNYINALNRTKVELKSSLKDIVKANVVNLSIGLR